MTNNSSVCDYKGYDYQHDFWGNRQRQYEDQVEKKTISRKLKTHSLNKGTLLDAGCGFGRLFPAYSNHAEKFILLDFADNMLSEAKKTLGSENIHYQQGQLTDTGLSDSAVDTVISIRTLHHIEKPAQFFKEVYRLLKPGGVFLFEIPNQGHLLNRLKFVFKKLSHSPKSELPMKLGENFYNFNPDIVLKQLKKESFKVLSVTPISFFRVGIIKKIVPVSILVSLDLFCQRLFSFTRLTPSLYVVCEK